MKVNPRSRKTKERSGRGSVAKSSTQIDQEVSRMWQKRGA